MDLFVNFIQSNAEADRSRQNINILNSIIQELNNDLEQVVENQETQGEQEDNYKPATKEFIDSLEEKFPGSTIILFGSYSRGEDLASSDVDLAVIGCSEKKIILKKYEKFLEREIRINFFKNLKKIEKEFKESLCNGIVFSGGIEL